MGEGIGVDINVVVLVEVVGAGWPAPDVAVCVQVFWLGQCSFWPVLAPGAMPVGVGTAERRHRERVYYDKTTIETFNVITDPMQMVVGLQGSMNIAFMAATAQMEAALG